jgi:hypothetical protein
MIDETDGATFQDPITLEEIKRIMDGFVDNMSLWATLHKDEDRDTKKLVEKLQHASQWWEKLLHASGGKLELEKCFFYILHWKSDPEGKPFLAPKSELPHRIILKSSETGKDIEIQQRDCAESHKTLGSMENPSRVFHAERDRLAAKNQSFAGKFTQVQASQQDVYTLYDSFYIPSMCYTLPTTQFTMAELHKIQNSATSSILHALGYNKNTPRAVVYGPDPDGGIGMRDFFVEQGTGQSQLIMGHIREGGDGSGWILTTLNWLQLWTGQGYSLLETTDTNLSYLPDNLFSILRIFLNISDLSIEIKNVYRVKKRRTNDIILMEEAIKHYHTPLALDRINRYRMYKQVECLSDICSADGTTLRSESTSKSKKLWTGLVKPFPKTTYISTQFL